MRKVDEGAITSLNATLSALCVVLQILVKDLKKMTCATADFTMPLYLFSALLTAYLPIFGSVLSQHMW